MLHGPVGLERVYVHAGPRLDHERFLAGLKAGHSFVTNGPLLSLTVAGRGPGEDLLLPAPRSLPVHVTLRSIVPVDHLEIIGAGRVVASIPLTGDRTTADTTVTVPVQGSGWLVLRARGDGPREPVLDLYPFASTSPVYVTMNGALARSAGDARFFVHWIDQVIRAATGRRDWNTTAERDTTLALLTRARAEFVRRGGE
jgi:hypothetical protein